ncbi:MAG: hypothetical protein LKE40_04905 [Spirochaetia bacterium]|jgi:hypothetical protein|nr:hypothetical protein [Spirochaetia bacterium]
MAMSKLLIIHNLKDFNALPALERWFRRYHVPEVLTQYPWTNRYLLYRVIPEPDGAERFGFFNYRVHENWVTGSESRRGERGLLSMTQQPYPDAMDAIVVNMPAEPTDDFLGSDLHFDDHTILRWVCVFRYPDGADIDKADDWYLNVHVPEMKKTPGLNRYFSTKAYISEKSPLPQGDSFKKHMDLFYRQWHRVTELWFDDSNSWKNGIIGNLPKLTRPSWATDGNYPFIIPGSEFISTFILEKPDNDFIKERSSLYF